jgi:hypothetical protein
MVDLSLLQSVSYIAGALGVCVAAFYYVMTLRVQQENMKATLETRQAQFLMSLYQRWSSKEYQDNWFFAMFKMSWIDYEDFTRKYPVDSREANQFYTVAAFYKGIGLLVEQSLVEAVTVAKLLGGDLIPFWEKFKPIILEIRVRLSQPGQFTYVEYLYNHVKDLKVIPPYQYDSDVYDNLYSKR